MYSRFIRWATDRLNDDGIISFVSNSSFIDALAFDGFRKVIGQEFNELWIIDTKGNARKSGDERRKEGGNIFSDLIKVGIAVYFLVKNTKKEGFRIYYHALDDYLKADEKKAFFTKNKLENINFTTINPDKNNNWINLTDNDFDDLLPIIDKKNNKKDAIFEKILNGIVTARDEWVYDLSAINLSQKAIFLCDNYNGINKNISDFNTKIKWSEGLKNNLKSGKTALFCNSKIIKSLYRPFSKKYFYADLIFNDRLTSVHSKIFGDSFFKKNIVICLTIHKQVPFAVQISNIVFDYGYGSRDTNGFSLYRYENGERIENISDWGLEQFRNNYQDKSIKKEDIFNYVYGVLHNPKYREKYELNLKREFPRIPFYDDFWQWVKWGFKLMELHLNYETIKPYKLKRIDIPLKNPNSTPKPKLKADKIKGRIILDEITTLEKVPLIAFEYKLGNRSALEWILDQYKEKKPRDKTIAERFNNYRFADYKEQVIDLLQRVTTVSVETLKIIKEIN